VADNPLNWGASEGLSIAGVVETLDTEIEIGLEEVGIAPDEEAEHELRWGSGLEI
jgi:hypothetical protein